MSVTTSQIAAIDCPSGSAAEISQIPVALFRGFAEDRRVSMEIYADTYLQNLREFFSASIVASETVPRAFQPGGPGLLREIALRYCRFCVYPSQAKRSASSINHILEPGYAHLMRTLDPARTIVTVHDMIPILGWRGVVPGLSYGRRPRLAEYSFNYLRHARYLITVSEATKRDLVKYLECRPDRIVVSPNGLDPAFESWTESQRDEARLRLSLPPRPARLVLIAGHQQYKNHETSLKVLRSLLDRRDDVQFVHLGRTDEAWQKKLEKNGLRGKVMSFSKLPLSQVVALFNAVDLLLFPSWYEGFGWPALQALACGTSVVASNAGSLPEVVGDCGLLRAPSDVDGLREDVERLLDDHELRKQLASRGIIWARQFTWQNHVSKVVDLYRQTAASL